MFLTEHPPIRHLVAASDGLALNLGRVLKCFWGIPFEPID